MRAECPQSQSDSHKARCISGVRLLCITPFDTVVGKEFRALAGIVRNDGRPQNLPTAGKSTMRDRHTIFCGVLRSLTSLSSRSRSSGGTWIRTIMPIQADLHPYADLGIL